MRSSTTLLAAAAAMALGLVLQGCVFGGGDSGSSWQADAKAAQAAADKQLENKYTKADKKMVSVIHEDKLALDHRVKFAKGAAEAVEKAEAAAKKDDSKKDSKKDDSKSGKASAAKASLKKAVQAVKDATKKLNTNVANAKKAAEKQEEKAKAKAEAEDKKASKKEEKKDAPKKEKKDTPKEEKKEEKKATPKEEKKDTPKEEKKEEKKETPKEDKKEENKKTEGKVPADKKEAKKDSEGKEEKFLMVGQAAESGKMNDNFMAVAFNFLLVGAAVIGVSCFVATARHVYIARSSRSFLGANAAVKEEPFMDDLGTAGGDGLE